MGGVVLTDERTRRAVDKRARGQLRTLGVYVGMHALLTQNEDMEKDRINGSPGVVIGAPNVRGVLRRAVIALVVAVAGRPLGGRRAAAHGRRVLGAQRSEIAASASLVHLQGATVGAGLRKGGLVLNV